MNDFSVKLNEALNGQVAYHLTTEQALADIIQNGITNGNTPRYGKTGHGVYVFFSDSPLNDADALFDYLGIDNPALVQTIVDPDSLLMDEDSLFVALETDDDEMLGMLPPEVARVIENLPESHGMGAEGERYIPVIDKFQLKPRPEFPILAGRYEINTARCIASRLPVSRAWVLDEDGEWVEYGN